MTNAQTSDPVHDDSDTDETETDETEMNETGQQLIAFIRERPWTCVIAAAGLGFVIGRLLRGDR